ncbi:MAG: hypothetical protein K2N63_08635 [Lachnospiraceae bacterium]|nr:hypothetical protein [Lachnospiraceae bacterium]
MEQEKKKSPHFLHWPWNVVVYILLCLVLRLFAIPVILIIMAIQKKNNPHGVEEGYCLSRTRKRLPEFLIALLLLFVSMALGALFFHEIRQPKDDWEMMDYVTLVIAGGGALLAGIGGIYEAFVSVRDSFFPAKSSLAKSIRKQLPHPEEAPPVEELFAMVDNDLKANGEWFDTVCIGQEWVLGDAASRIDRIRAIFTVDEIHQHRTQTGIKSNRTLQLVLVDDRFQAAITTFRKPKELQAAADCLSFRVPSAFRGINGDYLKFLSKNELERETYEREFQHKEAMRASARAMRRF